MKPKPTPTSACRPTFSSRSKEEIKQLVDRLQSPATDDLFKVRAQIASQLKVLVQTLLVGSLGEEPRTRETVKALRKIDGGPGDSIISYIEQMASRPEQSRRFFAVGFRDSNVRIIFPDQRDPLRFEEQVTADPVWGIQRISP